MERRWFDRRFPSQPHPSAHILALCRHEASAGDQFVVFSDPSGSSMPAALSARAGSRPAFIAASTTLCSCSASHSSHIGRGVGECQQKNTGSCAVGSRPKRSTNRLNCSRITSASKGSLRLIFFFLRMYE